VDKYGVVLEEDNEKTAAKAGRPCPYCGSTNVNYNGLTPHCPTCGTKPWEKKPDGTRAQDYRR
jgi:uncharacterized Zn finger protein (UPF0148 family)